MSDCIFCKIIAGDIPCDKLYEDKDILAFNDINPEAPVHFLIIPKKHIATINETSQDDQMLLGKMILKAKELAAKQGINESGFRMLINCNEDAGQTVWHIHLHVMGGAKLVKLG